jgi:hypothetical protein
MTIQPDGIQAAADREQAVHPTHEQSGKPITAWQRRADTLNTVVGEVNELRSELDELKEAIRSRPF